MAHLVKDAGDEVLRQRFGTGSAQRLLFASMARGFQPRVAYGFEGDIGFELLDTAGGKDSTGESWWTVSVRAGHAVARPGPPEHSAATIRIGLPDFMRMISGCRSAVEIVEEGRAEMDGDVILLARLPEMFGGLSPVPVVDEVHQ
jgi:hypothetical protein